MEPRVTFLVASYNYGRYLAQTIDSLLDQTIDSLEVIVIDDLSTDNSRDILRRYDGNPRVRVFLHERNLGNIRTYNEGLALARGEFVGLMGSDDYCLRRDAVERQLAVFDAHPKVGFVFSACTLVDENGIAFRQNRPRPADSVRDSWAEFAELAFLNYVPHSGTLVRRSCHDEVGVYDPELPYAGDWDLWLRLAARYDVGYIAEPLFAYRVHGANMSIARHAPSYANRQMLRTIKKAFAALPPSTPIEVRRLRAAAIRNALLTATWNDRSLGRVRRSWLGLADAVRCSPRLLTSRELYVSLAKLLLLSFVGHSAYERLAIRRAGETTS